MTLPANHYRTLKRDLSLHELLADGIVHALALLAGVIAFPLLLFHALQTAGIGTFAALAVYAAGFFLMWGFSLAYNMTPPSALKWLLRRFDHSMIYVMIAGTYTAVIPHLGTGWGWTLGLVVWTGAALGIVVKVALPGRYDRLAILLCPFGLGRGDRDRPGVCGPACGVALASGGGRADLCGGRGVLCLGAAALSECDLASVRGCRGGSALCGGGGRNRLRKVGRLPTLRGLRN